MKEQQLVCIYFTCRLALTPTYSWQNESNMYLPGGAISVAHQFLRCVLHQLAPNGVFTQMFQTNMNGMNKVNNYVIIFVKNKLGNHSFIPVYFRNQ